MPNDRKPIHEGYRPQGSEKGYQPSKPSPQPTGDPKPQGGYVPTSSDGESSTPPGDE